MDVRDWIGRSETHADFAAATPYAALSALLDRPAERPPAGTPLPPLWHWLYFLPLHRQSELGPDGHAQRGGFLPPVALPRRMWAGGRFVFNAPLAIGDSMTRVSTIEDVARKRGRTGELVFVKVRHDIHRGTEAAPALSEWHDIVYRAAPRPDDPVPLPRLAPAQCAWEREWLPDDVLLFRYSALTFNAHRIHFDRRYATGVEGYPGLVVHGPLVATLLLDLVRHERPAARIAHYEFRAVRPLFDLHPLRVCGAPQPDGTTIRLWAKDHQGYLAMEATAVIG